MLSFAFTQLLRLFYLFYFPYLGGQEKPPGAGSCQSQEMFTPREAPRISVLTLLGSSIFWICWIQTLSPSLQVRQIIYLLFLYFLYCSPSSVLIALNLKGIFYFYCHCADSGFELTRS